MSALLIGCISPEPGELADGVVEGECDVVSHGRFGRVWVLVVDGPGDRLVLAMNSSASGEPARRSITLPGCDQLGQWPASSVTMSALVSTSAASNSGTRSWVQRT